MINSQSEEFDALQKRLDEPLKVLPSLAKLMNEKPSWEDTKAMLDSLAAIRKPLSHPKQQPSADVKAALDYITTHGLIGGNHHDFTVENDAEFEPIFNTIITALKLAQEAETVKRERDELAELVIKAQQNGDVLSARNAVILAKKVRNENGDA